MCVDMQSACRDRTPGSVLSVIRDSALQQIDLKNDVCDGRQRSRSTDAAACVRAQMSLVKRYLELPTCQVLSRKVVRKKDCVQLVLRTFCAQLSESKKKPPLAERRGCQLGTDFKSHRGDRIRTCGILLPKQARYQTAPLPGAYRD